MDVYTIISYGTKISEVSRNVQEKVKYNLEALLGVTANSVNVFVQGVRVLPDIGRRLADSFSSRSEGGLSR